MIGIITGAFDFLHAGHTMFISEAKDRCNYLIVALHVDPSKERKEKNKPVEPVSQRYLKLKSNKNVNEIIPYETEEELKELFLLIKPDVYFLGSDWKSKHWAEKDFNVEFIERKHHQSSSNIRKMK